MSDPAQLPPAVRAYVRGYVMRGRRLSVIRGAGLAPCVFVGVMLASCVGDRFGQFPSAIRAVLLGLAGLVSLLLLLRPLLQLTRPQIDWLAVTAQIEDQDDRFGQRLQTVTSRLLGEHDYRGSDEMLDKLSYELNREAADERPSRLLPARRVAGPWLLLAALLGVAYALLGVPDINLPRLALRFLTPWQSIDPVTTTRLVVAPGDRDLPQGASVVIEAAVGRLGGGLVWLHVADGDEEADHATGTVVWQKFQMAIKETPATSESAASRPAVTASPGPAATPPDDVMRFTYSLTSIDRDLKYYVTAGDARSHTHVLRALRRPAVAALHVRYIYPPHTGRPPVSFTSVDGRLEAPTGTEAEITVVSTEPLKSALLTFAGDTQALVRPPDDATGRHRFGRIVFSRDGKIDLGLVSNREQAGTGPVTAEVKVVPDRPPIVRMGGTGQTLRLGPRDLLPVSFEAIDDFGVESLVLRAQVGSTPPVELNVVGSQETGVAAGPLGLPLLAVSRAVLDARRREGLYDLDLARLPLAVGDLVTLVLAGRDTSNQVAVSETVHVLVSPRSIGIDAYELISELDAAALLAASTADDLEDAARRVAGPEGASSLSGGRASRRFAAAGSSAALVRRALVRGIGREPPASLSGAMLAWVDDAQTISASAEACFRELGGDPRAGEGTGASFPRSRPSQNELLAQTRDLAALADRLAGQLRSARDGQRALVVLADLENATAAEKRGPPKQADKTAVDRYKQSLSRLREDIAGTGKALGLQPSSGDFRQKLRTLVDRGQEAAGGRARVDYLAAAVEWAQQVQRNTWRPVVFGARLAAAAQAEAVRPGGDLRVARDYNLASRAAAMIEATGDRSRPVPVSPATANALVTSLEALVREHETFRRPTDVRTGDEQAAVRSNAARARLWMEQWSGPTLTAAPAAATAPVTASAAPAAARSSALESLAMQAGAAAADGAYAEADRTDRALSRQLSPLTPAGDLSGQAMDKARRATASAGTMDGARAGQLKLIEKSSAANPSEAAALADDQRRLADTLDAASPYRALAPGGAATATARDRAAQALIVTQNRLVAMPQQLAEFLDADATHREAAERASRARDDAEQASPDRKAAAQRSAEMAAQEQATAAARLAEQAQALNPSVGQALLLNLDSAVAEFADQPSPARDAIGTQLTPALKNLVDSAKTKAGEKPLSDRAKVDHAAAEVRQAIDAAQQAVGRTQDELAMQDPLTSARWYARAAADALSRKPPDFRAAERSQRSTAALLSRARDDTLRYASGQRMLAIRSARPVMAAPVDAQAPAAAEPAAPPVSAWSMLSGEFRRLRPREMDDATGILHRADPPGYEASIKAYFEAIEKTRDDKGK